MQLVTTMWFQLQHLASWLLLIIFMFSHPALSFYLADTRILGVDPALGYSVFQTLPFLFPPPLSPPTNYQTEGSGAD